MSYSKRAFLQKLNDPDFDMVEFARFMLPYKINGWSAYSLLTALDVNNGDYLSTQALDSSMKEIYANWYNYVCSLDENLYGGATASAIRIIKKNPNFNPMNMTSSQCREFVETGYDDWFKGAGIRPMQAQNKGSLVIEDQLINDFVHIFPFGQPTGGITCRLYLNIKPEFRARLSSALVEEASNNGVRFYGKMWTGESRNDGFVVYTNYAQIESVVQLIEDVKSKEPYLFDGADKGNPLLAKVNDYVRFGEEPTYKHASFNGKRASALDEFYNDILSSVYSSIGNYNGTMQTSDGKVVSFKEYLDYRIERSFRESLAQKQIDIANGVYPSNVLPEDRGRYVRAERAIYNHLQGEFPDYIKQQISEQSDSVIKSLKAGEKPYLRPIVVRTVGDDFTYGTDKDYADRVVKQYGYFNYPERIDYDIAKKLIDAFGMEPKIERYVTESNLKPYLNKHHIACKNPHLNLETEEDMGDLLDKK